jgi:serine/threonine-protein kinase
VTIVFILLLGLLPAGVLCRFRRETREASALGSYELVERLGAGGMGEVWLARHRLLARRVAIKLIRADRLGDGSGEQARLTLQRFEREAQATAALTSPHTIRLFDFGVTDQGAFYYVMELLNGRDLESLVDEFGPLPPARALFLVSQICRSLAEAHALGLVHRDIKPANAYVCRMGLEYDVVKVLDFGLVRHESAGVAPTLLTDVAATMGTPAYMAPEVILGSGEVDRRADVYAIGCVAYFLLTGVHVFGGRTPMKVLMQHVQEAPLPPSRRIEQVMPPGVDDMVMACLDKDPERRPRDASSLLDRVLNCPTSDEWDQASARRWWKAHLPQLAEPVLAAPAGRAA